MTKPTFKTLKDYDNAYRSNRLEVYQAATSFLYMASLLVMSLFVYVTLSALDIVIGWF